MEGVEWAAVWNSFFFSHTRSREVCSLFAPSLRRLFDRLNLQELCIPLSSVQAAPSLHPSTRTYASSNSCNKQQAIKLSSRLREKKWKLTIERKKERNGDEWSSSQSKFRPSNPGQLDTAPALRPESSGRNHGSTKWSPPLFFSAERITSRVQVATVVQRPAV